MISRSPSLSLRSGPDFFLPAQFFLSLLNFGPQQLLSGPPFRLSILGEVKEFTPQCGSVSPALPRRGHEPRLARFLHQLFRSKQPRQMLRNAVQCRETMVLRAMFLRFLYLLPLRPNRVHGFRFCISEDVRMPPDELFS